MSSFSRYAIVAASVTGIILTTGLLFKESSSTPQQPFFESHVKTNSGSDRLPNIMRYQEGVHYTKLKHPFKTQNPELREVFSYACPHCSAMQPVIHALQEKGINVYENPMPFMRALTPSSSRVLAIGLIAARERKLSSQYSEIVFKQFHQDKKREFSDHDVVSILSVSLGVPVSESQKIFENAQNSPLLQADLNVAKDLLITNREIPGVPSFIVDGQYVLNLSSLSKDDLVGDIINVTRFLQEKNDVTTTP